MTSHRINLCGGCGRRLPSAAIEAREYRGRNLMYEGGGLEGLMRAAAEPFDAAETEWTNDRLAAALQKCADLGSEDQMRHALGAVAAALRSQERDAQLELSGVKTGVRKIGRRNLRIAAYVLDQIDQHGAKREAAYRAAEIEFGLGRSTIQQIVKRIEAALEAGNAGE